MKARSARHLDLFAIKRLSASRRSGIVFPSQYDEPNGILKALAVPGGQHLWVAETKQGIVGFTLAQPRPYVLGWELIRLFVRPDVDVYMVVGHLMQSVFEHLQDRGIPRLFARTTVESFGHEVLHSCGFTHLLSEALFAREPGPTSAPEETPSGMRYKMPQDAWPLRQLENAQTPALVSELEGLTSLGWSTPTHRPIRKQEPTELVVERDGDLVAWVGWTRSMGSMAQREQVRLGLMSRADDAGLANAMLAYALHAIKSRHPNALVLIRLRDYQLPVQTAVLDYGFEEVSRETLHIKHGRLQLVPKKASRFLELAPAPAVRAFTLESTGK